MIEERTRTGTPLNGVTDLDANAARANDDDHEGKANEQSSATPAAAMADQKTRSAFDMQIENLFLPGYSVEQDGVFTVVRRKGTSGRSGTFPARIARWLMSSKLWLPLMIRFTFESVSLAPYRMIILLVNKTISSLAPAARLWATSKMLHIVEKAIETGRVQKGQLGFLTFTAVILATGISRVKLFFARNAGILERHFEASIMSRLLQAGAPLGLQQWQDPEITRIFSDAGGVTNSNSDVAFKVVGDIVKTLTSAISAVTQAYLLRHSIHRGNLDLFLLSFAANFIKSAEWLFRGDPGFKSSVTNIHYQRMQTLASESNSVNNEGILLGLPAYLAQEYRKANERLGDTWTYRLLDKSRLARTTGVLQDISEPLLYALFALRAAGRRRSSAGMPDNTFTMGGLAFIQNATSALASEIGTFAFTLDDVRQHCTEVLQFYRALNIKPDLKGPKSPVKYITQVGLGATPGTVVCGMGIELRQVSFKYPASERNALQDVSFKVKPGQLCCIVGYNGAGKSTLLDLICRIVDPTSGSIRINGVDAKEYSPQDIYRRISCQYQNTLPCDVTLREFMHMGDVHNEDDEARIHECLCIAGIAGVIARFSKGLDARLGPYPANPTPQSTLREFAEEVQTGVKDPWDADYTTRTEAETREDEENEDEVVGGAGAGGTGSLKGKDCAFSPGEWQKLCFARSLMKKEADLRIFDEPSASLDPLASKKVFDQIESLRGKSTIIHITHDLAACIKADQVIMFEDGKLIETGTHTELLAQQDSKYRAFYLCHIGQEVDGDGVEATTDDEDSSTQVEDEDAQIWEDTTNVSGEDDAASAKDAEQSNSLNEEGGKPGRARGHSAGQDSGFQVGEDDGM